MMKKIVATVDHLRSSVKTKWMVMALVLSVVTISAIFAPLVWATDRKLDSSSRLVTFYDDGVEKTIITKSQTVGDALKDAEITIDDKDKISPSVDTELTDSMTVVNIRRARPVTVIDDDGRHARVVTAEVDSGKIAALVSADLQARDTTETTMSSDFIETGGAGQELRITRAKTVSLKLYGQDLTIRTQKKTVADMLTESGIALADNDTVNVDLTTPITDGMSVQVWRNGIQTIEAEEEVPFDTQVIEDSSKKVGYVEVQTAGQVGKKTVIYQVNMQNGVELSREKISEVITVPAVSQVEVHGTKVDLPPGSHTDWMRMAGIPESDFGAANYIISRESGWRYNATNASSGAYGLPQALPGSKMASAGSDWETNPITQLKWFYSYCKGRYGSVQGAYEFWQANHWY